MRNISEVPDVSTSKETKGRCHTTSVPQRDETMACSGISRSRGLFLVGALLAGGMGCSSSSTDVGEPLSITLTVDRTTGLAAVDTFSFHYEATGTDILGVVLEFGDGQEDSLSALGAARAGATRNHVYGSAGVFSASARVLEALGALRADTVVVEVNQGGEMVKQTLMTADASVVVTEVRASRVYNRRAHARRAQSHDLSLR